MDTSLALKMALKASLLLVGVMIFTKSSEFTGVNAHSLETRQTRFCGPDLSAALDTVCESNFYGPRKRLIELEGYDNDVPQDAKSFFKSFVKRNLASSATREGQLRLSRQVHDECCRKPCTVNTLRSYCA